MKWTTNYIITTLHVACSHRIHGK